MTAYYNEWDSQAAAWLRELIKQGHIADGAVDDRDIKEVEPADLREFTQCHFFAGIGGWSVALRLAGWPDDRPVWTGSPPCQPFSVAGRGKGIDDDRHIAPVWLDLVKECRPSILFGEQVAAATSKDGWLDALQDALENEGYATGAAVLPACSVNAPHIRQRLWFTGRLENTDTVGRGGRSQGYCGTEKDRQDPSAQAERSGSDSGLADPTSVRHSTTQDRGSIGAQQEKGRMLKSEGVCSHGGLADTDNIGQSGQGQVGRSSNSETKGKGQVNRVVNDGGCSGLADTASRGRSLGQQSRGSNEAHQRGQIDCEQGCGNGRTANASKAQWGNPDWLWCRDGKWRPVESSTFPLAHGLPARVGRLRGYGNAIVPQVAAEVIQVMMEYSHD